MRFNHEREYKRHLEKVAQKFPKNWANKILNKHYEIRAYNEVKSNLYLTDRFHDLEKSALKLSLACTDSDLIEIAEQRARMVETLLNEEINAIEQSGGDPESIFTSKRIEAFLRHVCEFWGVVYPELHGRRGAMARLIERVWWLRQLRVAHAKLVEALAIDSGLVGKKEWLYVSEDTLERRKQQIKRNDEILKDIEIKADTGEKITLDVAAASGMANPVNRVNELITRLKGYESLAKKYGHECVFITITAPSRFHCVAGKNPKYKPENKPDITQKFLSKKWSLARAKMARRGVNFYGLRVVEPHADGTPHWHMALWYKQKTDLKVIRNAIKTHFLRGDDCDYLEAGSIQNRLKFMACDSRGAVGYMLKYILKNMRAHGIDGELSDESESATSESAVDRVEAWAATWRIRQFQVLGGHSVTTWRELRRVDREAVEGKTLNLMDIWLACQRLGEKQADFAAYIEAQGGLNNPKTKALFTVDYEFVNKVGRYGEAVVKKVIAVMATLWDESAVTNRKEWKVV